MIKNRHFPHFTLTSSTRIAPLGVVYDWRTREEASSRELVEEVRKVSDDPTAVAGYRNAEMFVFGKDSRKTDLQARSGRDNRVLALLVVQCKTEAFSPVLYNQQSAQKRVYHCAEFRTRNALAKVM